MNERHEAQAGRLAGPAILAINLTLHTVRKQVRCVRIRVLCLTYIHHEHIQKQTTKKACEADPRRVLRAYTFGEGQRS